MTQNSQLLLNMFGSASDRGDRKHWAAQLAERSISRSDAVDLVSVAIKEQLMNPLPIKGEGVHFATSIYAYSDYFTSTEPSDEELNRVIFISNTDYYANLSLELLRMISRDFLPQPLKAWEDQRYLGLSTAPSKPPGQSPYRYLHRDTLIISQITQLELVGFAPMRSRDTPSKNSGCDIVADALETEKRTMDYSAIEAVWKKRARMQVVNAILQLLGDALLNALSKSLTR